MSPRLRPRRSILSIPDRDRGAAIPQWTAEAAIVDHERSEWLGNGMRESGVDALIASMPEDVLLLTGYFPVVGASVAIATAEGRIVVIAPKDERELADGGGADEVIAFQPASLDRIMSAGEAISGPLRSLLRDERLEHAVIGFDAGEVYEPASYASMLFYGSLEELCRPAKLRRCGALFSRLKARLTAIELGRVRRACRIALDGFTEGKKRLATGLREADAAANFRRPLFADAIGREGVARAEGYVFCMAGEHSAEAYGAYARSRASAIRDGDFVLTHCNSHADGYWTDITRTYCMGKPSDKQYRIYQAVFEARQAALAEIRPGARARDVDGAARDVMRSRGFADNFKHPAGHGVGFAAINHNALPRLHPASGDWLECGMVFNVEPAVYLDGFGGVRHCDMVAVTPDAHEVLTPCHCVFEDLLCETESGRQS